MNTFMEKKETVERKWFVIDAEGVALGRLATKVATVLKGKHKATFTPHIDCGDYVIVVNADQIVMTGNKMEGKKYYSHSMYPGGLRVRTAKVMKANYTVEWVEKSIHGMLPHTRLGDVQRKHLFVYKGSEHPHAAQKPVELKIKG